MGGVHPQGDNSCGGEFEDAEDGVQNSGLGPWLTLDRWQSRAAFDQFQQDTGEAYRRLDAELESLTADELFIGAFDERP